MKTSTRSFCWSKSKRNADAFALVDDLASGGVYLSFSGGYIDDIRDTIEEYQAKIISGEIVPPSVRP